MATSLETEHPVKAFAWAAEDPSGIFCSIELLKKGTGEHDIRLRVLYCGIRHSDLHLAKNDWGITTYPVIPGHEIVGAITEVGSKVEKFKTGDKVGIGCLVGSCRQCEECINNGKSYCPKLVFSVNDRYYDGTMTYGGFSNLMVCKEHFIICWPENLPLDSGAPLLCAGITTYSQLRRFGLDGPGVNVGVVGLGGIGHLSVKFAKALGSRVTVISTSANKKKEAIETFGADDFLIGQDQEQMQAAAGTLDGIIHTVSAKSLPITTTKSVEASQQAHLEGKVIVGIASGGVKEVEEMVEFAAQHNILPDVEVTPIDYVNKAMGRLEKSDVKYRFVVDVGNSIKVE